MVVFVLSGLAGAALGAPAPPRAIDPARLEALVDGAVAQAMAEDAIAGVTVAVVDGSGVLLAKGYGLATPEQPVDPATLFRVGSISKTVLWIALMQLVEQGKLSLDDPINDHLPAALRVPDEGFREPIRVRHLMTHSAGFEDSILGSLFVADPEKLEPLAAYLASHRVHRVRPPGQLAAYSNYGAALAGALVAEVSGLAWEDYAEQRVLRPLGMTSATYREPYPAELARARGLPAPMPADVAAHLSAGWQVVAGHAVPQSTEFVEAVAPAGALSASALDMAVFLRALLDPARMEQAGVLRAATALELREPLFASTPALGPLRHGFLDYRLPGARLAFGHDGGLMFQHSRLVVSPDLGVGIFLAINTAAGGALHENLCAQIVREFFGGPERVTGSYGPTAAADARALAGTYLGLRRPYFRTERALLNSVGAARITATPEGDLVVPSFPGQPPRRYVPLGGGRYVSENGLGEAVFEERDGRTIAFESFGIAPSERLGFLDQPLLALALLAAAHAVVLAGLVGVGLRWRNGRAGSRALDSVTLVWAAALALFWIGLAPLAASQSAAVYRYPGPVLPIACWAFALAALVTLFGVAALPTAARSAPRPRSFWLARGGSLALLLLCSIELWRVGLLGYSGW